MPLPSALRGLLSTWLLEALAPSACAACGERIGPRRAFCAPCATSVERVPREPAAVAFAAYGGAVARAIARFKYGGEVAAGRALAQLLVRVAPELREDRIGVVVPVPLHPDRLAERGFNQATLLARPLARALGAPLVPTALVRTRSTRRQVGLPRSERLDNVTGAFRVARAEPVAGGVVLLVDDVTTSGATLAACARTLHEGGARRVVAAVVARAGNEAPWSVDVPAQLSRSPRRR